MSFVLPHTALKLRESGFPQGVTTHLWHKMKGIKVSLTKGLVEDNGEHWVLCKRNKNDISAFGDVYGYNRWVSAPTTDQVREWAEEMREMRREAKVMAQGLFEILSDFLAAIERMEEEDYE